VYLPKPLEPAALRAKLSVLLGLVTSESLHAKVSEQRAVQEELERRLAHVQASVQRTDTVLRASIERTARTRAYKAFVAEGGLPAYFADWWPTVFSSAWASEKLQDDTTQPSTEMRA
jgi:hypothetical protein